MAGFGGADPGPGVTTSMTQSEAMSVFSTLSALAVVPLVSRTRVDLEMPST
jgi:hypothetical protein